MKRRLLILSSIILSLSLSGCGLIDSIQDKKIDKIKSQTSLEIPDNSFLDDIESSTSVVIDDTADTSADTTDTTATTDTTSTETDNSGVLPSIDLPAIGDIMPDPDFYFTTYDVINEEEVDQSIITGHRVTMVNFWEPWCGPCVGEMPDLQKLFEEYGYGEEDFIIIGVYEDEDDAMATLNDIGTTYPVLKYVDVFDSLQSGYVPNTVFFDARGKIIYSDMADEDGYKFIGSRSLSGWREIIDSLLESN